MSDNKLFNTQGRLELLNEVTKEGMLSLEQTEIRGNAVSYTHLTLPTIVDV